MGKGGGGSAPAAPDPVATANAQAEAYIKSAKESSKLNNLAQTTPWGSVTFDKDAAGVPTGQRITLNPEQQAAYDSQARMQAGMSGAAERLSQSVPTGPFGIPTGLPGYTTGLDFGDSPDYIQGIDFSRVNAMPGTGDFSADRANYSKSQFDRAMSLMQPQFDQQQKSTRQMLSDRGLPITGEASSTEMDRLNRSQNETMSRAAFDAVQSGAQEQSRLFGLGLTSRQAGIGEQLQNAQTAERARQGMTQEQIANAQLGQGARQGLTNEALLEYNAPAQAISTLLGASPKLPTVQGQGIYQQGVQAPDIQGATYASYNANMNAYNQRQQQQQSSWGGIASLVGSIGGMIFSDENAKEDFGPADGILERMEAIPIKSWRYKNGIDDGAKHVGPMAQDFHGFFGLGNGRSIPVVDAVGVNMAATQALARKVRHLEKRAA